MKSSILIKCLDFLNVRKIPLKEYPYVPHAGSLSSEPEHEDQDDPDVDIYLEDVRSVLKTDRALNDHVRNVF